MEAFNGPLGKLLSKNVWEKPIGTFEVIPVEDFPRLQAIVLKGLNNDAKTLYNLCLIVITGLHIFFLWLALFIKYTEII